MNRDLDQDTTHRAQPAAAIHTFASRKFAALSVGIVLTALTLVGCGGMQEGKESLQPRLGVGTPQALVLPASARVTGSAASVRTVGFSVESGGHTQVFRYTTDGESPSSSAHAIGVAPVNARSMFRLVGMDETEHWVTSDAPGLQTLGRLDLAGAPLATTMTADGDLYISPIEVGQVWSGAMFTKRTTVSDRGNVSIGVYRYQSDMGYSTKGISGWRGVDFNGESPVRRDVADTIVDNGRTLSLLQDGIAVVSADCSESWFLPFDRAIAGKASHLALSTVPNEAVVLADDQVLVVSKETGKVLRSASTPDVRFETGLSSARRLFVDGGVVVVVTDSRLVRFDLAAMTRLPDVTYTSGRVVAAEMTNGKLFLAQRGAEADTLLWVRLHQN